MSSNGFKLEDVRDVRKRFSSSERKILHRLNNPKKVQDFLDIIPYNVGDSGQEYSSPRTVLEKLSADCFEGALFAAAALRFHGDKPLIYYTSSAPGDHDHTLALFKRDGFWGAISKSKYTGLGFREPIHRDLRELTVGLFEDYFDFTGKKTLRGYSRSIDLSRFDSRNWMITEGSLKYVEDHLNEIPYTELMQNGTSKALRKATVLARQSGELGMRKNGTFDRAKKYLEG